MQRGSPESKEGQQAGRESEQDQRIGAHADERSPAWARAAGWRTAVYSHSLGPVMGGIFALCWLTQFVAGWSAYNEQQLSQQEGPVSRPGYLCSADFWSRTFENWQSEFLAVGSFAVLAVYLHQRGSPESKPVGTAHDDTGVEG